MYNLCTKSGVLNSMFSHIGILIFYYRISGVFKDYHVMVIFHKFLGSIRESQWKPRRIPKKMKLGNDGVDPES